MAAGRIQRWALISSAYSYNIQHKDGKANVPADALSRIPVSSSTLPEESEDCDGYRRSSVGTQLWTRRALDAGHDPGNARRPDGNGGWCYGRDRTPSLGPSQGATAGQLIGQFTSPVSH
ncbi:uncharacterized protein LOC125946195 [Dermacentor silvarum]|uniref:uncharacterized protein LOC125946195 n=1 Tax=Dermacentor silvarum TaxID=543639 RepID=UPI0021015DFB|nr:uncharacterized protein LOC125946195 [Dermacentor silvarum]